MNINYAVMEVASRFQYQKDKWFLDTWSVMREKDGWMRGDCDDFVITCIWYACDKNLFTFIWNVFILHRYRIYSCKTFDGEGHFVGCVKDNWFDNWTLRTVTKAEMIKETNHKIGYMNVMPIIAAKMFFGLFYRYLH